MAANEEISEFSVIYVSETEDEMDYGESHMETENESATWISERKQLQQMSHSILSPSFRLSDSRSHVSETDISDQSDIESIVGETGDCDIESIFDTSDSPSFIGDSEEESEEVMLASQEEIAGTQEKIQKYLELIEDEEHKLQRRLTAEEKDVLYVLIFNTK